MTKERLIMNGLKPVYWVTAEIQAAHDLGHKTLFEDLGQVVLLLKTLDRDEAQKLLEDIQKIQQLAAYARTVRLDRTTTVDGQVYCLQTHEWCLGLLQLAYGKPLCEPTT
jgi:hypothetical protein